MPEELMNAVVFHRAADVRVERCPVPAIGVGEVLVEVTSAGICGSDVGEFDHGPVLISSDMPHPTTGHVGPLIMGHEFAGRVVEAGPDVIGFRVGDLVASGSGVSCGECRACRRGRTNLCERYWTLGFHRDGGLAQYCAVPARVLRRVDEAAVTEDAAGLAQPIAIATHSMRRGLPQPGQDVATIGAGGVGAFLVAALRALTEVQEVVTVEPAVARREVAATLGATAIEPGAQPDRLFDTVYEVSGTKPGFETAMQMVERGGRIVLIGLQQPWLKDSDLLRQISFRELELVGPNAHVFASDFADALVVLESRRDWSMVAPQLSGLEAAPATLASMAAGHGGPIKSLFDPRMLGSASRAAVYA